MCLGQGSFWSPWECLGTRSICDKGLERGGRAWLGHTWTVRAVLPRWRTAGEGEHSAADGGRLAGPWPRWRRVRGGLLRDKVQSLTEALTQSSASLASTQDKNVPATKALTACEHDRQNAQYGGPRAQLWGARWRAGLGAVCGCTLWEILAQYADWPMRGGWGCHNGQDGVQGLGQTREQGWGLGAPASWGPVARPALWLTTQMRALPTLRAVSLAWRHQAVRSPLPRAPMQPGTPLFPQERLEAAAAASSERGNRAAPGRAAADLAGRAGRPGAAAGAEAEDGSSAAGGEGQGPSQHHLHLLPRLGPASRRPCSSCVRVPITQVQRLRSQGSFPTVGLLIAACVSRLAEQLASSPPA